MANATAAAFALDIDVAIVADSVGTKADTVAICVLLLLILVAIVADKAGTKADTAAILVSSVADVVALAAAKAIEAGSVQPALA